MATRSLTTAFDFVFDASTSGMAAGLQAGSNALEGLKDEAQDANRSLRAIPNDVNVDVGLNKATLALLRADLLKQKAEWETLLATDVDVDTSEAKRKLFAITRELKALDRLDVEPDVNIDVDGAALAAASSQIGNMSKGMGALAGAARLLGPALAAALPMIVSVGVAAGGAVAGLGGVGLAGYKLLDAYAELEAGNIKFATVFGKAAQDVEDYARESYGRAGVSLETLKTQIAGTGDILKPVGFTEQEASEYSQRITDMALALADFNPGVSFEQAQDAASKAILGERESLKTLGIVISENAVQKRKDAIKTTAEAKGLNDEQLKYLATLQLIEEGGKDATKAYADGANTAQNRLRALSATLATAKDDLILGFGEIALSIVESFQLDGATDGLNNISGWIEENRDEIRSFMLGMVDWALGSAEALLIMGQAGLQMAEALVGGLLEALPTMRAYLDTMSFMIKAASFLPGPFGDAARAAGTFLDGASEGLYALEQGAGAMKGKFAAAAEALDGPIAQVRKYREQLDKVQALDDLRTNLKLNIDNDNVQYAEKVVGQLTKEEIKQILVAIPKDSEDEADKTLRRLARKRKAEIRAEATGGKEVDQEFNLLRFMSGTKKERQAMIKAQATNVKEASEELDAIAGKKRTAYIGAKVVGGDTNAGVINDDGSPAGRSVSAQSVNVNLDGRRVASVIADRQAQGTRDVWV